MAPYSGGSRNVRKGGAGVTQRYPAGGLGGAVSPPTGSGEEPRRQTHFGNNLLKIGWKSGLWPGSPTTGTCTTHWLLATWSHGSLWEGCVFLVSWVKISFGRPVFSLHVFCTAAGVGRAQQQAGCRRIEKNPKAALFCLANRCSRSKITERWMYSVRQIETLWLAKRALLLGFRSGSLFYVKLRQILLAVVMRSIVMLCMRKTLRKDGEIGGGARRVGEIIGWNRGGGGGTPGAPPLGSATALCIAVFSPSDSSKHFTPWRTCLFIPIQTLLFSGKHSATVQLLHKDYSLTYFNDCLYSQVLIYTAEWTEASGRERKCPKLWNAKMCLLP